MKLTPAVGILLLCSSAVASAADLSVDPLEQGHIVIDALSDTHCPVLCGLPPPRCPSPPCADSIACCDTFAAIVGGINLRPRLADYTFLDGDLGITSRSWVNPWMIDRFFQYYNLIPGAKSYGMGNHEADAADDSLGAFWADPLNHYAPANWLEPLYGCDSTTAPGDCRRWYSVSVGNPPRVVWIALSNNSDDVVDEAFYAWCNTPNDRLNHAASEQRRWLNEQIDALPPTVEVVFVAAHRTYYGVENFSTRPNIERSLAWGSAQPETLRTGEVSFLRDLESIYDRAPNVQRVFMITGDQHCFSETVPIRRNVRDDDHGVVYVTLGISGGWIGRGFGFPSLSKIPPNTLVYAFQDKWGSTRFDVLEDRVQMSVREAYTDSLIYQTEWTFPGGGSVDAPIAKSSPKGPAELRVWPSPSVADPVRVEFRPPDAFAASSLDEIAVCDVTGRVVRQLPPIEFDHGTYRTNWNGTDADGRRVAAGEYFVRARQRGRTVAAAKLTVIH